MIWFYDSDELAKRLSVAHVGVCVARYPCDTAYASMILDKLSDGTLNDVFVHLITTLGRKGRGNFMTLFL